MSHAIAGLLYNETFGMSFDNLDKRKQSDRLDVDDKAIEKALNDFERAIKEIQMLYEQFFAGANQGEPFQEKRSIEKLIQKFNTTTMNATAQKFRFQSLRSRYNSLKAKWERTTRQIEEGTYRRDKFRLKQQAENNAEEKLSSTDERKRPEAFNALYEKLRSQAPTSQRVPSKEKFVQKIQKQIEAQKKKHPDKKVNIRLQKDDKGHFQVKMSLQKKT